MTDLIDGLEMLFTELKRLEGDDRRIFIKEISDEIENLSSLLSAILLDSVDDEILSEGGNIVLVEALETCYDATLRAGKRGGFNKAMIEVEQYCVSNDLCGKCFGKLTNEDYHITTDIEEYWGARVSRKTVSGYSCPHCGYQEEY